MSRALVTGATGFLGRHVLATSRGRDRVALVRGDAWPYDDAETGPLRRVRGELSDVARWRDEVGAIDVVVHLAGEVHHSRTGGDHTRAVNVGGAVAAVEAAAALGARRVVIASTSGVVGCFRDGTSEADEDAPFATDLIGRWPYYDSKREAEVAARDAGRRLGVEVVLLRPPMLYGPGDHRFRTTSLAIKILRRKMPARLDGGVAFTDVRDVAAAFWAAADHPSPRPVYHLPGVAWTVERFFAEIARLGGTEPPKRSLPYGLAWSLATATAPLSRALGVSLLPDPVVVEMGACHWGITSRYAATDLGFSPRPPEETLADTVAWLFEHHPELKRAANPAASADTRSATEPSGAASREGHSSASGQAAH